MGSLQLRMYDYRGVPTPVLWSMSGDQRDVWHHVVLTFEETEGPFQVTPTSGFVKSFSSNHTLLKLVSCINALLLLALFLS